jgi:hypothetical protein
LNFIKDGNFVVSGITTEDGMPCGNGVNYFDRLGKILFLLCLIAYELCHGDVCGSKGIVPKILTSIPHEDEWPGSRSCHFNPEEKPRQQLDRGLINNIIQHAHEHK